MGVLINVVLVLIFLYLLKKIYNSFRRRFHLSYLPGPPSKGIRGNFDIILNSPEDIFKLLRFYAKEYWPIYKFSTPFASVVAILHPDDFEQVMNTTKHSEKSRLYHFLKNWLGEGLLTSKGDKWHHRRKILTPAFHFEILQKYCNVFNSETDKLVHNLKQQIHNSSDKIINVLPAISQMTLQTILETAMGITEIDKQEQSDYKNAIYDMGKVLLLRLQNPLYFIKTIYNFTDLSKKERKLLKILHSFTSKVINQRQKQISTNVDFKRQLALLDILLHAKNDGVDIDFKGIREEVDTFMFEGHDTSATAISFLLMVLAKYPDVQEKVYEEISFVVGSKEPTFHDLQELKYTERVIKESLRLYPSVPFISRLAGEDFTTHNGYFVPKGCVLHLHIFDLHRNPRYYPEPDKFDPDRFLPDIAKDRHKFAYLPFSAGPRNCIGQKFAMLEIKSVICGIIRNFKLKAIVDNIDELNFFTDLVLRVNNALNVKLSLR